jgi:alginate O-acetyltransferase complex protein AlgJ
MTNQYSGVLVGKDNFLFLNNDSNFVLKQIQGKLCLTPRHITFWKNLLLNRVLHSNHLGIKYKFIIPPNKETIYRQYLPDEIIFSENRPVNQILEAVDPLVLNSIYYNSVVEIDKEMLFPRGETHWCDFFAYDYICKALLNTDFQPLKVEDYEIVIKPLPWYDLGTKVDPFYSEKIPCMQLKNRRAKCIYSNNTNNMGRFDLYENLNKSLPTAVVFRDSFYTNIMDLFAESFSKVIYVWHPWIDWDVVEKYKPDFLINATVERFLVNLPNDLNGKSWEELSNDKK